MTARKKEFSDEDYARLADFRHALRCFLEFSETAAAGEGLTPRQHQALLVIRSSPPEISNIQRLAERLRLRHNTAVELAKRLESGGLVTRTPSPTDGRSMLLVLTRDGRARLERLTRVHRNELKQLRPVMAGLFKNIAAEGK